VVVFENRIHQRQRRNPESVWFFCWCFSQRFFGYLRFGTIPMGDDWPKDPHPHQQTSSLVFSRCDFEDSLIKSAWPEVFWGPQETVFLYGTHSYNAWQSWYIPHIELHQSPYWGSNWSFLDLAG
jgi:hypothetical protein